MKTLLLIFASLTSIRTGKESALTALCTDYPVITTERDPIPGKNNANNYKGIIRKRTASIH